MFTAAAYFGDQGHQQDRRSDINSDLSTQMIAMNTIATQNSVQIAVFKKANEMQNDLLKTLTQAALAPPPPGQGLKVDKQA